MCALNDKTKASSKLTSELADIKVETPNRQEHAVAEISNCLVLAAAAGSSARCGSG